MTEVVEEEVITDDKDPRLVECRAELDFIQSQVASLEAVGIDKKFVMQGLKELRDTITVQRKHHPKLDHVYKQMSDTNPRRVISAIIMSLNLGQPSPEHEIQKLTDFLSYVPRFKDSYSDMFEANPIHWEKFRDYCMKQKAQAHTDPIFPVPHDEVRYRQMYEKYLHDWKQDKPWYEDWIKDYFRRNGL